MPRTASAIPVGTQFSPALVRLHSFLEALCRFSGDRGLIQTAVWKPPVHLKGSSIPLSGRRANLPLEAAVQYGLLTPKTYHATDLTRSLAQLSGLDLHRTFARHILLNCGGLRVVEAAEQMKLDKDAGLSNVEVTGDSLARYLSAQGFLVTEHNTAINSLRMWLAEAGLFPKQGWTVDPSVKVRLLGMSDTAAGILAGFSDSQTAFTEALCRIDPSGWCKASDVRDLAESTSGIRFGRASLPKEILEPLKEAGLIDFRTRGTSGGKVALLRTTSTFSKGVLLPFLGRTIASLDSAVTAYYRKRPEDVYAAMESRSAFIKGQALEAYAIHIMRLLHLRFIEWRKRGQATGGAEIDATFSGLIGLAPTVWQVQCKNTPSGSVRLEDVSKEVGQVPITHATHILIVANASITRDAAKFADETMRQSPITVFLLGKSEFETVRKRPGSLGTILRLQAERILLTRTAPARLSIAGGQ